MCVFTVLILYIFIKHRVVFVMREKLITTNGVSFAYWYRETLPTPQDTIIKYPPG